MKNCPDCRRKDEALKEIRAFVDPLRGHLGFQYQEQLMRFIDAALAAQEQKPWQMESERYACESCGYIKGRPIENCGHVGEDGCCIHPKNITPECHDNACPLVPYCEEGKGEENPSLICTCGHHANDHENDEPGECRKSECFRFDKCAGFAPSRPPSEAAKCPACKDDVSKCLEGHLARMGEKIGDAAKDEHEDWCLSTKPIHEDGPCNCKPAAPAASEDSAGEAKPCKCGHRQYLHVSANTESGSGRCEKCECRDFRAPCKYDEGGYCDTHPIGNPCESSEAVTHTDTCPCADGITCQHDDTSWCCEGECVKKPAKKPKEGA